MSDGRAMAEGMEQRGTVDIDDARRRPKDAQESAGENGQCGSGDGQFRARDMVSKDSYLDGCRVGSEFN